MAKRVSIMIQENLDKKLRQRQAKLIQQRVAGVSYSEVLNEVLDKGLSKIKK